MVEFFEIKGLREPQSHKRKSFFILSLLCCSEEAVSSPMVSHKNK